MSSLILLGEVAASNHPVGPVYQDCYMYQARSLVPLCSSHVLHFSS